MPDDKAFADFVRDRAPALCRYGYVLTGNGHDADDAALDAADGDQGLWNALATLPPRQRAVLVLRCDEHLTDGEIADTFGIARGTIRSQAARALDKLRAMPEVVTMGDSA